MLIPKITDPIILRLIQLYFTVAYIYHLQAFSSPEQDEKHEKKNPILKSFTKIQQSEHIKLSNVSFKKSFQKKIKLLISDTVFDAAFIHLLIHSINKCLWSSYQVVGTITEMMTQAESLPSSYIPTPRLSTQDHTGSKLKSILGKVNKNQSAGLKKT